MRSLSQTNPSLNFFSYVDILLAIANQQTQADIPRVPDYLSSIHRPSTNPLFQLDTRPGVEFFQDADLNGSSLRVEIWGHVTDKILTHSSQNDKNKGKGKEKAHSNADGDLAEWKILESWDFDLADLIPLPDDVSGNYSCHVGSLTPFQLARNPSFLPYNSLLITLSSYGQAFYLPSHHDVCPQSRTPSPSPGYGSDPESEVRKIKNTGEIVLPTRATQPSETQRTLQSRGSKRKRELQSATWQDLLK